MKMWKKIVAGVMAATMTLGAMVMTVGAADKSKDWKVGYAFNRDWDHKVVTELSGAGVCSTSFTVEEHCWVNFYFENTADASYSMYVNNKDGGDTFWAELQPGDLVTIKLDTTMLSEDSMNDWGGGCTYYVYMNDGVSLVIKDAATQAAEKAEAEAKAKAEAESKAAAEKAEAESRAAAQAAAEKAAAEAQAAAEAESKAAAEKAAAEEALAAAQDEEARAAAEAALAAAAEAESKAAAEKAAAEEAAQAAAAAAKAPVVEADKDATTGDAAATGVWVALIVLAIGASAVAVTTKKSRN